jgi:hypothetical protein
MIPLAAFNSSDMWAIIGVALALVLMCSWRLWRTRGGRQTWFERLRRDKSPDNWSYFDQEPRNRNHWYD